MKFRFFSLILLICIVYPMSMHAKKDKKARKKILKLECRIATIEKAFQCHLEQTQEEIATKDKIIEEQHQELIEKDKELELKDLTLAALKEEHKKAVVEAGRNLIGG